jgi:hypothetical protein
MYGSLTNKLWFKAGAPNGERNLQNYNPMIRAEEQLRARGIKTVVAGFAGLPAGVKIPAVNGGGKKASKPKTKRAGKAEQESTEESDFAESGQGELAFSEQGDDALN